MPVPRSKRNAVKARGIVSHTLVNRLFSVSVNGELVLLQYPEISASLCISIRENTFRSSAFKALCRSLPASSPC